MTRALRFFQKDVQDRTDQTFELMRLAYPGQRHHVVDVMPTGGGKTILTASNVSRRDEVQLVIAHRQELVSQQSIALANEGIRHRIVAPNNVVSAIRKFHIDEVGRNFVDPQSHIGVGGVDTLVARKTDPWFQKVTHAHIDEAHHVLAHNKWGKAILEVLHRASSTGYTATPGRADGQGISAEADGIYHAMIEGPRPRHLINWGYLTDYRYICEETSDLDLSEVALSADGDFNRKKLSAAVHKSRTLVADVVDSYLDHTPGALGITFTTDVEEAVKVTARFRERGVPAEVVTGNTPDHVRRDILKRFRRREILMLVNVDLFGEGFDVPAAEVVILARPTKSFPLFAQQVGRILRLLIAPELARAWDSYSVDQRLALIARSAKPIGIVIDLVGNWKEHGMPDNLRRVNSMARSSGSRERDPNIIQMTRCLNPMCFRPYEAFYSACPHCGEAPTPRAPAERTSIEVVNGSVGELTPEALALLRGEIDANTAPPKYPFGATPAIRQGIWNRHQRKLNELEALKESMMLWGAGQSALAPKPLSDAEQQRYFYLRFGVDVLSAQALPRDAAEKLRLRIEDSLKIDNIIAASNNSQNLKGF